VESVVDFLHWLHHGAGLSFEAQVVIKSTPLIVLLGILFFVPDSAITRNRSAWPIRISRTWCAIACAIILADYWGDGFAKHLVIANFYASVVAVVASNRWAARHLSRYVPDAKPYEAP